MPRRVHLEMLRDAPISALTCQAVSHEQARSTWQPVELPGQELCAKETHQQGPHQGGRRGLTSNLASN